MKAKIAWITVATVVVLGLLAALFWFVPIFKPNNVEVTGLDHLTAEEVIEAADVDQSANLLRLDEAPIAHRVSDLSWVDAVNVRKQLPSTVVITVTEHQIAGYSPVADGFALFDADGKVFMYVAEPVGGIVVEDVPENEEHAAAARSAAAKVLDALPQEYLDQLARVSAPNADEITLVTHDDRRIFWGTAENIEAKVTTMKYALTRAENNVDISGAPIIAVR